MVRVVIVFACVIPVMVLAVVVVAGAIMVRSVVGRRQDDHSRWYTNRVAWDRGAQRIRRDRLGSDDLFRGRRLDRDRLLLALTPLPRVDGQLFLFRLNRLGGFTVVPLALGAVAGFGRPHHGGRPCAVGASDVGKQQFSVRALAPKDVCVSVRVRQ